MDAFNVTQDGKVDFDLDSKIARELLSFSLPPQSSLYPEPPPYIEKEWTTPLSIVIQVVGSRGDVQPFVALGCELGRIGHRVRIATHGVFKAFVQSAGLEFFPIGGDPVELMAYMVKNPGLLPGLKSLRDGEISKKRSIIREILEGCWGSCILPDPDTDVPFVANAIIANPPSFAHVHCAQALGVPLHMMFTMPWSPTSAFTHPLANLKSKHVTSDLQNYYSYLMVSYLTWHGQVLILTCRLPLTFNRLADIINSFRENTLGLEAVPLTEGALMLESLGVPYIYCWSPALIPKPLDWPAHIDVCGFIFRSQPQFSPSPELRRFLDSKPRPIYIGFGSIVVDDAEKLFATVLEAVAGAGVRAIISPGWSTLSVVDQNKNKNIFFLTEDTPHEWLFPQVAAVVHHGGAGTTACGLACACPTVVVPFFGDQEHWGKMVAAAGAGPSPIPYRKLSVRSLTDAILPCFNEPMIEAARLISTQIKLENGVTDAVASFHRKLATSELACELLPQRPAAWLYTTSVGKLRLCGYAAEVLVERGLVKREQFQLFMPKKINIENQRWDPASGAMAALGETTTAMLSEANGFWKRPYDKYRREKAQSNTETLSTKQVLSVAGASLSSGPRVAGVMLRGFVADVPLAIAEGFRATPKLYGEEVQPRGPITGLKSGTLIAGKNFVESARSGAEGLATHPMRGYRDEGMLGLGKGICKGVIGSISSTGCAIIGLVAYPGQGMIKSLHSLVHTDTKRAIIQARIADACYERSNKRLATTEEDRIVAAFLAANRSKDRLQPSG